MDDVDFAQLARDRAARLKRKRGDITSSSSSSSSGNSAAAHDVIDLTGGSSGRDTVTNHRSSPAVAVIAGGGGTSSPMKKIRARTTAITAGDIRKKALQSKFRVPTVELSKSGASTCKICDEKIDKDVLRVCLKVSVARNTQKHFRCLDCFLGARSLRLEKSPTTTKCRLTSYPMRRGFFRLSMFVSQSHAKPAFIRLDAAGELLRSLVEDTSVNIVPEEMFGFRSMPHDEQCTLRAALIPVSAEARAASADGTLAHTLPEVEKSVALAKLYSKDADYTGWIMSEKLDGMRCIWCKGGLYSRKGIRLHAPAKFTAALERLSSDVVLDGELHWGHLPGKAFADYKTFFQSVGKASTVQHQWNELMFCVFDCPSAKGGIRKRLEVARDVLSGGSSSGAGASSSSASSASSSSSSSASVSGRYAVVLPVETCRGKSHLQTFVDRIMERGGEGCMLRHPDAEHKSGRTADLLKVKPYLDAECKVVGLRFGRLSGGTLDSKLMSVLNCILLDENGDSTGTPFTIENGFSMTERQGAAKLFPLGTVVTFKYQSMMDCGTGPQPRHPSFMRVRSSR